MNKTEKVIEILREYSKDHPVKYKEIKELINELYLHGCRRLVDK